MDNETFYADALRKLVGTGLNIGQQFALEPLRQNRFEEQMDLLLLKQQIGQAQRTTSATTISPTVLILGAVGLVAVVALSRR